jgi:hypothetical protein
MVTPNILKIRWLNKVAIGLELKVKSGGEIIIVVLKAVFLKNI